MEQQEGNHRAEVVVLALQGSNSHSDVLSRKNHDQTIDDATVSDVHNLLV